MCTPRLLDARMYLANIGDSCIQGQVLTESFYENVHSKNRLVEKTTNLIGWPNIGYILVVLTNILVN